LNTIAEKLKRQSKDDFEERHFETWLIVQAVTWHLRYPLSYRDSGDAPARLRDRPQHDQSMGPRLVPSSLATPQYPANPADRWNI
jgi:hypothetical protein